MKNFSFNNQVLERSFQIPVIVEFSADGCGPCLWVEKQMVEIHRDNSERFDFVSIPISMFPKAIELYTLQSNPTLIIFKNGEPIARLRGALPKIAVLQWVNDHI